MAGRFTILHPPQAFFNMNYEGNNVTYNVYYIDENGKLKTSNRRLIPIHVPLTDFKMSSVSELPALSDLSLGDETEENDTPSLEELPFHVLQRIFYYLPEGKITDISQMCPVFNEVGNSVMFKKTMNLHAIIVNELRRLRRDLRYLEARDEPYSVIMPLYRSYYMLETLKSDTAVFQAFCRHLVTSRTKVINIGPLLEVVFDLLNRAVRRDLPPMHPTEQLTYHMNREAKKISEKEWDFVCSSKIGIRIMDMLDAAIEKMYKIIVRFVPQDNLCVIDATYILESLQYISAPPQLANTQNLVPSPDDKRRLLLFLNNVVKINNKIILRDEQYQREMEANHREVNYLEIHLAIGIIFLPPPRALGAPVRTYFKTYPLTSRNRRVREGKVEIHEKYISQPFEETPRQRVKGVGAFRIKLQCSLSKAPYSILRCWQRLKTELGADGQPFTISSRPDEEETANDEKYLLYASFETQKLLQNRGVVQIEAVEIMEAADGQELAMPYSYPFEPE